MSYEQQPIQNDQIVINGRSVSCSDLQDDASKSSYILVRTTGDPLDKEQKDDLDKLGVKLLEFVGDEDKQIYLCGYKHDSLKEIRNLNYIDYADIYSADFVVPAELQQRKAASTDSNDQSSSEVTIDVLLHHDVKQASDDLLKRIAEAAGKDVSDLSSNRGFVRVTVDPSKFPAIADIDEVRVIHDVGKRKLFNNIARGILKFPDSEAKNGQYQTEQYRGAGQIVCVADTGLDTGNKDKIHEAFTGRVQEIIPRGRPKDGSDPDGHGTHVCGSVLGSGNHSQQGKIEGTAPEATLVMQSTMGAPDEQGNAGLDGIPEDLYSLFLEAYNLNARVHTNSWGVPVQANGKQQGYATFAEKIDKFVFDNQDMCILFAAGNDGTDADGDGKVNERSLGAESAAKNVITVGASENNRPTLESGIAGVKLTYGRFWPKDYPKEPLASDHQANNPDGLAAFSSRGPTDTNRLKPDVVAPGTAILSARSRNIINTEEVNVGGISGDDKWMYLSGTSMATPLAAGCCAVLRENLVKDGYKDTNSDGTKNATGSLIKAMLINGAVPIAGQYMPKELSLLPNPHSGFGRVNIEKSIVSKDAKSAGTAGYGTGVILRSTEAPVSTKVKVPSGKNTFKCTMTYADPQGAKLINDLNLVVSNGTKERHGNQVDKDFDLNSKTTFDRVNNVEQVTWSGLTSEEITMTVKPYRLMQKDVPFAFAWRFD